MLTPAVPALSWSTAVGVVIPIPTCHAISIPVKSPCTPFPTYSFPIAPREIPISLAPVPFVAVFQERAISLDILVVLSEPR